MRDTARAGWAGGGGPGADGARERVADEGPLEEVRKFGQDGGAGQEGEDAGVAEELWAEPTAEKVVDGRARGARDGDVDEIVAEGDCAAARSDEARWTSRKGSALVGAFCSIHKSDEACRGLKLARTRNQPAYIFIGRVA